MSIADLYQRYRAGGLAAALAGSAEQAGDLFYRALLAFGAPDVARAAGLAEQAADRAPEMRVYRAAATYLATIATRGQQNVYLAPEAFGAFIRGGGNLPLYQATSAALRARYQEYATLSLLDIGVGDGLALLPALTDTVAQIDLVEPSAAMLEATTQQLQARGRPSRAFGGTLQEFASRAEGHWDVVQATFSLQSLAPGERAPMQAWLRAHAARLLIAEFDAPGFADMYAPERAEYVLAHYEQGLAEYAGDGGLVAQGFLMPVLFGYFDQTAARTNYEQPIAEWVSQLRAAGFETIVTEPLYNYWWAPAYLIDARSHVAR
jgi:hypothetical protein